MAHSFLTWIGKALTIEHYPHTFRFNGRCQSSEHNREGTYIWNEQFIELIEQITEFPSQRVLFLTSHHFRHIANLIRKQKYYFVNKNLKSADLTYHNPVSDEMVSPNRHADERGEVKPKVLILTDRGFQLDSGPSSETYQK